MNINIFPALNTLLLLLLMAMVVFRLRLIDLSKLWDEIEAIKLRVYAVEKTSPCQHCRKQHGIIGSSGDCGDC